MKQSQSSQRKSAYVEGPAGWRFFFFAIAISCALGLYLRIYLSPPRIKSWVTSLLESHRTEFAIRFSGAELRLAKGALPEFALVLKDVEIAPRPECVPEPSLQIQELRVPFRLSGLLTWEVRLGTVGAENIILDLDRFKARCVSQSESVPLAASQSSQLARTAMLPSRGSSAPANGELKSEPGARVWWQEGQLQKLQAMIDGVEFKRVEVKFEESTKSIYLESFALAMFRDRQAVHLNTDLRIPKEVTYGEALPPLSLHAEVFPEIANVSLRVALSEGQLLGRAVLTPSHDDGLFIDSQISVKDVPLSTLVPLLTKAGVVKETFRPRFLWLDCEASIAGRFQGLFRDHPLKIQNCLVEGTGGSLRVEAATRYPDGRYEPFLVQLDKLELRRLFETFSVEGPAGVASDFGRLSGKLEVLSGDDANFAGVVEDMQLRFSNRSVRGLQRLSRAFVMMNLKKEQLTGRVNRLELKPGQFQGELNFQVDRLFRNGNIKLQIQSLALDERIQELMIGGKIGHLSGSATAQLLDGRVAQLDGDIEVRDLVNNHIQVAKALAKTRMEAPGRVQVEFQAPEIRLIRQAKLFDSLAPLFFNHQFAEAEYVPLRNTEFDFRISELEGVRWVRGKGQMEEGQILLHTVGAMTRNHELNGWVSVDYPKFKKLKWSVTGLSSAPVFLDDSESLRELRKRILIDDKALGLRAPALKPGKKAPLQSSVMPVSAPVADKK